MSDNIYEATGKYITKYDEYDLQIKQTKLLLLDTINEYIHALNDYFKDTLTNYTIDVRGELIFLQTNEDIDKKVITAINNLSEDTEVEFELNIADDEKTILIYINSLYENITTDNEIEENTDEE